MWINNFSSELDSQEEGGISMWNISEQISEAYKEEIKSGAKRFKKTKKDEKKAKRDDMLLAKFLVKILIDKSYDSLFPQLFKAFDVGVPSNLILGIMSLVYTDISNTIRASIGKESVYFSFKREETLNFSWDNLPQEVKDRINYWVEDMYTVISFNSSKVYTKRIVTAITHSEELYDFTTQVFIYFLSEINIYIQPKIAREYARFILQKIILQKIKDN